MGSRLRLTDWEQQLLVAVGAHLSRARAADLAAAQRRERANDRQKALSARFGIHSRYAGSICVDNDAAVRAAREQLWSHQLRLQATVRHLERRTALPSRAAACGCGTRRCDRCGDGYATENERVMKRRRLSVLRAELADVQRRHAERRYSVCLGGGRLATTRHHLYQAGLSEQQWRERWQRRRAWFGCVGNTGKPGGNPCLSLRADDPARPGQWFLTVSVPEPVRAAANDARDADRPGTWRLPASSEWGKVHPGHVPPASGATFSASRIESPDGEPGAVADGDAEVADEAKRSRTRCSACTSGSCPARW